MAGGEGLPRQETRELVLQELTAGFFVRTLGFSMAGATHCPVQLKSLCWEPTAGAASSIILDRNTGALRHGSLQAQLQGYGLHISHLTAHRHRRDAASPEPKVTVRGPARYSGTGPNDAHPNRPLLRVVLASQAAVRAYF